MASPFSVFRKNQTYWMAALVVVAIISFIIAPALEQVISSSYSASRSNKSRIVSWRGGTITEEYALRLQQIHGQAQLFLNRLAQEVIASGGVPKVPGFEMVSAQQFSLGLNPYNDRLSVIQTKLFAERAAQLGITISDEAVEQYLVALTANRITNKKYTEIFKETTQGNLTHFELVSYLKDELSARMLLEVFESGVSSQQRPLITPEQNWQIFQKFHRKAKIEAFPVLVSDYLEAAKSANTPTDKELRAIYEEGKERIPFTTSSAAGFKRRHSANVEFVSANLEEQIKAAVSKLTEEEIKKEYEAGVAAGRFKVPVEKQEEASTGTPITPAVGGEPPAPGAAPINPPAGEAPTAPAAETPAESTPQTTPAPTEPAPTTPEKSEGGTPTEPAPATETPATPEAPVGEQPKQPDAPKDGGGQAMVSSTDSVRLVSFQEPAAPAEPAQQPPAQPAETPTTPAETTPVETTPAAETPAAQTPAATQPPESAPPANPTAEVPAANPPAVPESSLTVGDAPATPAQTPETKEMRVQTLEEVRDELTRTMVFEATRLKLQAALSSIADKMQAFSDENQIYRRSVEAGDTSAKEPAKLELQKLADENGLQYSKTGLVDMQSVLSLPIGKSSIQGNSFGEVVLTPGLPLYSPGNSQLFDTAGLTTFVFWKIEEKPESIPSFEEAKSEVEAYWYQTKARDAAREKAEQITKQLEGVADSPWTAVLSETDRALVKSPNPFTWMTSGQAAFGMPSLTRVIELDTVGNDFMSKLFATDDGKFSVIPNEPQSIFYIVRVAEKTPSTDELHKLFGLVPNQLDTQSLAQAELQTVRREWMTKIEKDLDIAWEVKPADIQ